jgi:hypothetical protein
MSWSPPLCEPGGIALLIGDQAGVSNLVGLARRLCAANAHAEDDARRKAVVFIGVDSIPCEGITLTDAAPPAPVGRTPASMAGLYNVAEFADLGFATILATGDGSYGWHGPIDEPLARYLDAWFDDTWEVGSKRPTLYASAHPPLLDAVHAIAVRRGLIFVARPDPSG